MATETEKEVNVKDAMVGVSEDIVTHLTDMAHDVNAYIIAPRGQATLAEHAREALDRMSKLMNELVGMPESSFAMVPESVIKERVEKQKAREQVKVERAKEREKEKAEEAKKQAGATGPTGPARENPDAKGHQGRQHV